MPSLARPSALFAAIAGFALPVWAQPTLGPEIQLNEIIAGDAFGPDVAGLPTGFLSVWASDSDAGNDNVRGRLLDGDGAPLGSSFQINTASIAGITAPSVDADASGTATVVWGRDGNVRARRLEPSGAPSGNEFQVNTSSAATVAFANVSAAPAGDFVVAWNALSVTGYGYSFPGEVRARRYDSGGLPLGADFLVNSGDAGLPGGRPGVTMDDTGEVLIVWGTRVSDVFGASFQSIDGRAFDANGDPLGGDFEVSDDARLGWPDVAFTESGSALAVWEASGPPSVALARRLATTGPTAPAFPVNDFTAGGRIIEPSLVADAPTGHVLVSWAYNQGSTGNDTDWRSVSGRLLDASDDAIGSEFQINAYTTSYQSQARVAASDGTFVVSWTSYGSSGTDTVGYSVQSRALTAPPICNDGDGDGYGSPASAACTFPDLDCDDTLPGVNPGAVEIPGNGLDDDCDASTPPQTGCNPQPQSADAAIHGATRVAGDAAAPTRLQIPMDLALYGLPALALVWRLRSRRRGGRRA